MFNILRLFKRTPDNSNRYCTECKWFVESRHMHLCKHPTIMTKCSNMIKKEYAKAFFARDDSSLCGKRGRYFEEADNG